MLKNKTIKLIILGSLFPLLLTGCNFFGKSDDSGEIEESYNQLKSKYETFAKNIKDGERDGQLLIKLKAESEQQRIPTEILETETTKTFQEISNNFNSLQSEIENFEDKVKKASINEKEKTTIEKSLGNIKDQFDTNTTQKSATIGNIIELFKDGKLEKTEICEDIQIPLKVENITSLNVPGCGDFDPKTYDKLADFLKSETKNIGENITKIKTFLPVAQTDLEKLSKILIITSSVLVLGIIGSFIWIYLLSKKNKQIIDEILSQKEKIKNLENKNETRKSDIKKLEDKINELGKLIEREYSQIQLHLGQLDYKINDSSSKSYGNQNRENPQQLSYSQSTYEQTPPPPVPEDVRLTNLYKENPQGLLQNAIRVSMTKETVNKVLAGTWEGLVELESNSRQGEFYIVPSNSGEYYLFLDPNTLFNTQTLQQINKSQLFICNGSLSQKLKGSDINIIKPAIVEKNIENKWVFVQSGEIDLG